MTTEEKPRISKRPWAVAVLPLRNSLGVPTRKIIDSTGKNIVCNVYGKSQEEVEANARLIVEAANNYPVS